jgi:molybdopterin converting factor small subunit
VVETLGLPNQTAATEVPTMSMPNADPASTGAVTPANPEGNTESNTSTPIAQATEQEANGVLVNELESVDDQVVATVLADERPAGKTTQETLAIELDQVRAELERTKQELARVQRELADARRRQTTAPVRNVRTTVTLAEVLADGAVIRDRTGQEVIVPRGTTFEVVGERVSLGVPR